MGVLSLTVGSGIAAVLGLAYLSLGSLLLDSARFVALSLAWSLYFTASAIVTGLGLQLTRALSRGGFIGRQTLTGKREVVFVASLALSLGSSSSIGTSNLLELGISESLAVFIFFSLAGVLLIAQGLFIVSLIHLRRYLAVNTILVVDGLTRLTGLVLADGLGLGIGIGLCTVAIGPVAGGLIGIRIAVGLLQKRQSDQRVFRLGMKSLFQSSFFFSIATVGTIAVFIAIVGNRAQDHADSILLFLLVRGIIFTPVVSNQNVIAEEFATSKQIFPISMLQAVSLSLTTAFLTWAALSLEMMAGIWPQLGFEAAQTRGMVAATVVSVISNLLLYLGSLRVLAISGPRTFQLSWVLFLAFFCTAALYTSFSDTNLAGAVLVASLASLAILIAQNFLRRSSVQFHSKTTENS